MKTITIEEPIEDDFGNVRWNLRFPFDTQVNEFLREYKCRFDPKLKCWWSDDEKFIQRLTTSQAEMQTDFMTVLNARKESVIESRLSNTDEEIPRPAGLEYRDYQKAGIAYANKRTHVLIGDDMGLGKTVQAIGIVNCMPEAKRVLIFCPASLKLNWFKEFMKWSIKTFHIGIAEGGKFPMSNVVIINYDIAHRHANAMREIDWDVIILDEAHYLKSQKAQRAIAIFGGTLSDGTKLKPLRAKRNVAMTGTPIPNRVMEIFSLIHWLDPEGLGKNRYFFEMQYAQGKEKKLIELQNKMRASFMVRRLKKDVLTELPPKNRQIIVIPPQTEDAKRALATEKAQAEKNQAMLDELRIAVELAKTDSSYEGTALTLKEAGKASFEELAKIRQEVAIAKVPMLVAYIEEVLEVEQKVVIMAHHKTVVDALMDKLGKYKAVKIDGSMVNHMRQKSVESFQNDPNTRVFVGTIGAAGVGHTLTAARVIVFAELDWVPGNVTQAEDRVHRMGQRDNVDVIHFIMEGSLDQKIVSTLIEKQKEIELALDRETLQPSQVAATSDIPVTVGGNAATDTLTPDRVQRESNLFTSAFVEAVHEAVKMIAQSDSDQATERNGIGFNKIDSGIGNALAKKPRITPREAVLGLRIARRYHKQLPDDLVARLSKLSQECGLKSK